VNPAAWLWRTARLTPDAPALVHHTDVVADYAEFQHRAAAIGAGLNARHGIKPGSRVAVFMTNHCEYLEALYGIWAIGAVAVPINAKLHLNEAAFIIKDAGADLAFVSDDVGAGLRVLLPGASKTVVTVGDQNWQDLCHADPLMDPAVMETDDLLWLFYTSGTTGKPKGVMVTAGNITAMTLAYFADVDQVSQADAILYAAPMSHGAGIYNFMHVIKGARHVVPASGGFDAAEILELAPKIGPVSMFAAPTMVKRLVDHARAAGLNGAGIKTVVYAGGPMYLADIQDAVAVLGDRFVQIYGQGECPMGITALARHLVSDRTHPNWKARLASVGVAQSPGLVRIAAPDGGFLPVGETGEIVVKSPVVMKGYWHNDAATRAAKRDGWLWTGDMGAMDGDGFVTLSDRSKDMIISGGSNIYPREVEEVLLTHPDVSEVAVVGRVDAQWGEVVVAFVVARKEAQIDPAALDQLCLDAIARFKRPKEYRVIAELPKNNYGKVLKTDLRAVLEKE